MERTYKTVLREYSDVDTPEGLETRIIARIARLHARRVRLEAGVLGVGSGAAFGAGAVLLASIHETLITSGFYAYLSLVFSGDSVVYTFWSELAYALIESVPSLSIGMVFVLAMFCVWSLGETIHRISGTPLRAYA